MSSISFTWIRYYQNIGCTWGVPVLPASGHSFTLSFDGDALWSSDMIYGQKNTCESGPHKKAKELDWKWKGDLQILFSKLSKA